MPDAEPEAFLNGRRILVVEDEYLVAEDLRRALEAQGAEVIGPASSVEGALALLAADRLIDGAILDVNLRGEMVYPVAEILLYRGTPFVFATGYDPQTLPRAFARVPCCEKPYDAAHCARVLFG